MSNPSLSQHELNQFTGTEIIYRHPIFKYRYTEGAAYVAEAGQAFWLLDAIASWQHDPKVKNDAALQAIQFWTLTVRSDQSATLTCRRDRDDVVLTQEIDFTTFPLPSIDLYYIDGLILLPSEY